MDRIEEVKELMRLAHIEAEVAEQAKVDEVTTEFPDRQIIEIGPASEPIFEEYAQQIDQLYQPEEPISLLDEYTPESTDEFFIKYGTKTDRGLLGYPKAEEGGLLTEEIIDQIYKECGLGGFPSSVARRIAKAQRDLTSRLKDAEWSKVVGDIMDMRTEAREKCQERVEGVLAFATQVLEFAFHGDYSNGNEEFGHDEGRYLAYRRLEELEGELKALKQKEGM